MNKTPKGKEVMRELALTKHKMDRENRELAKKILWLRERWYQNEQKMTLEMNELIISNLFL